MGHSENFISRVSLKYRCVISTCLHRFEIKEKKKLSYLNQALLLLQRCPS